VAEHDAALRTDEKHKEDKLLMKDINPFGVPGGELRALRLEA
jgi:hypothetical protein